MKRMHVVCISALLAICFVAPVRSQSLHLGAKGGPTFTNFDIDSDDSFDYVTLSSFSIGAYVIIGLSDVISLQPEVLYSRKGADVEAEASGQTRTVGSIELDYLEIPLLVNINLGFAPIVSPRILAGITPAFYLSGTTNGIEGDTRDIEDGVITDLDVGITGGAGIGFDAGDLHLTFDIRYTLGLTNINDNSGDDANVKNTSLAFLFGIGL